MMLKYTPIVLYIWSSAGFKHKLNDIERVAILVLKTELYVTESDFTFYWEVSAVIRNIDIYQH